MVNFTSSQKSSLARALLMACLLTFAPTGGIAVLAADSKVVEMRFQVLLDDKSIGHHTFRIEREGNTEVVAIEAEFDVSVLFIPVYTYRHKNTEVWRDGCLISIESRTEDNGKYFSVNGQQREEVFELVARDGARTLPAACIMTFAYWNPEFLAQPYLLNAQNGEYVQVEIEQMETDGVQLAGGTVSAEGFRVRAGDGLDLKVWYERDSGRWLALESVVGNGKKLRYIPATEEWVAAAPTIGRP